MFGLSQWEVLVILIVALLLFGHKLPSVMRGLGSSVKEFKKGMAEDASPAQAPPAPPAAPSGAIAREAGPAQTTPKA